MFSGFQQLWYFFDQLPIVLNHLCSPQRSIMSVLLEIPFYCSKSEFSDFLNEKHFIKDSIQNNKVFKQVNPAIIRIWSLYFLNYCCECNLGPSLLIFALKSVHELYVKHILLLRMCSSGAYRFLLVAINRFFSNDELAPKEVK